MSRSASYHRPASSAPARPLDVRIDPPPGWSRRSTRSHRSWDLRGYLWGEPGHRPPIVLVHGLIVGSRMVAPTAERLAADGLVAAPELPGSGRSSKPRPTPTVSELGAALAAWLDAVDELAGAQVVLVGNSLGSQVALDAAARLGDGVAGLVLASPIVDRERRRWSAQIPRWLAEQRTQSSTMGRIMRRDIARGGLVRLARTFASALHDQPERRIRVIEPPVLVVHGTRDPLLRRAWCEELAELAPRGDAVSLPGVTHAMAHEDPVELARVISAFADRIATGEASPARPATITRSAA